MSVPKFEMESSFSDASDTDYDRSIDTTRGTIRTRVNPCDVYSDFSSLIAKLTGLKREYYRRPCIEGYCFLLFTPHRDRIQRRIDTLAGEQGVFFERCQRFQRDADHEIAKIEAQAKLKEAESKLKEAEAKLLIDSARAKSMSVLLEEQHDVCNQNEAPPKSKWKWW